MLRKNIRIAFAIVFTAVDFLTILAITDWQFTPYVFTALTDLLFALQFKLEEECDDEKDEERKDEKSRENLHCSDYNGDKVAVFGNGDSLNASIDEAEQEDA